VYGQSGVDALINDLEKFGSPMEMKYV